MTTRIGLFVFDGAEELDSAGPWEVLAAWASAFPDDDIEVFTLGRETGPITCAKGLRVLPAHTWETAPPIDVLIDPGGEGNRPHLGDPSNRAWLRDLHEGGALVTSV